MGKNSKTQRINQAAPALALTTGIILILAIYSGWITPAVFCLSVIGLMLFCLFTEIYTPALSLTAALAFIVTGSKANNQVLQDNGTSFLKLQEAFNGFSNNSCTSSLKRGSRCSASNSN